MVQHMHRQFPAVAPAFKDDVANSQDPAFGELPEWNLSDLYSAPDSADFKADLALAEQKIAAFEAHRGKIESLDGANTIQRLFDR